MGTLDKSRLLRSRRSKFSSQRDWSLLDAVKLFAALLAFYAVLGLFFFGLLWLLQATLSVPGADPNATPRYVLPPREGGMVPTSSIETEGLEGLST